MALTTSKPNIHQVYLAFNRFHQEAHVVTGHRPWQDESAWNEAMRVPREHLEESLKELGLFDSIDMDWAKPE